MDEGGGEGAGVCENIWDDGAVDFLRGEALLKKLLRPPLDDLVWPMGRAREDWRDCD